MSLLIKRLLFTSVCLILTGTGIAFGIKVSIGTRAWDAFALSTSLVLNLKVGTVAMFFNSSCVFIQLLVLKKDFKPIYLLQLGMAILLGIVVNIVLYDVLGSVEFTNYLLRLVIYIGSIVITAVAIALIMAGGFLKLSVDAACEAIANKTNTKFAIVRQGLDVFSIVMATIISLLFSNSIPIREGTIIGMLLFGPLLGMFIPMFKPFVKKLGLV